MRGDAALHHGDAEGQRLAGAGARLADQVGADQGDREGHLLDGEGESVMPARSRASQISGSTPSSRKVGPRC